MLSKFWLYLWLDLTSLLLSHLFLSCLVPLQTAEGFLLLVWSTSSLDVSSNLSDIYCLWAFLSVCSLSTQTYAFKNCERRKDILRKRFLEKNHHWVSFAPVGFLLGLSSSQCLYGEVEEHMDLVQLERCISWSCCPSPHVS